LAMFAVEEFPRLRRHGRILIPSLLRQLKGYVYKKVYQEVDE
jgi:hypothetical protein